MKYIRQYKFLLVKTRQEFWVYWLFSNISFLPPKKSTNIVIKDLRNFE